MFVRIPALAARHGAINLAQGVFDHGPPAELLAALAAVSADPGVHQYMPSAGVLALREAVASGFSPETEVTITAGATEALHCTMAALLSPGDEALVVEPAYEQYAPAIVAAGGVPVPVRLTALGGSFASLLEGAVTSRTRVVVVNSPWNPLGRVLTDDEWDALAGLASSHGIIVVSDETYEGLLTSRPRGVLDVVSDPELRVKISSVSKSLAATGWRIGWAIAGPGLTRRIRAVHQFVTFCPAVPLQVAAASVLGSSTVDSVTGAVAAGLHERAGWFADALNGIGIAAKPAASPFYLVADVGEPASEWCDRVVVDGGVAALPLSVFYSAPVPEVDRMVRFAVCKRRETLEEAATRLATRHQPA
ncbi:aminotransferase class I/II-fold pyridoxal phosphate-dependent enzyme [Saccharothrix sp.]|uniref:pyridoxal phosphate-dependent aminotransferase n=1 Tax=Saccharothrix sp. TaxID=1873460 RepID=UPI0028120D97|nr:aminotransferase class I/II-fold pyridoxal phosphate-dependent enzyme [Saccharothrix sp.]